VSDSAVLADGPRRGVRGRGRPKLPENIRRYQQAAQIRAVRYVPTAWKALCAIVENPEHPEHFRAIVECLNRGLGKQMDALVKIEDENRGATLPPELADAAVKALIMYQAGRVVPIDVPYADVVNGSGESNGKEH